jgi:hypothetical protein
MKPSPMSPFASPWQTMGMPPVAIRINPQTTLFVDLFNVSEFFQRVSARAQETRTTHDDPLRGADQAVAILQSTEAHGLAKYVGIFVKNFLPIHIPNSTEAHAATKYVGIFVKNGLQLGEQLNGSMPRRAMNLDAMPLSQAWETKAMPAIQEAIDKVYQTNLAENFNPNNDSRVQQFVENAVLDPLVLMPLGHIPKAVNLSARGTRVAIREINSVIKTARVALETPGVMKPAFATQMEAVAGGLVVPRVGSGTFTIGKELGFTTREMVKLQQAGKLEQTLLDAYKHIVNTPAKLESVEKFNHARAFLKPHRGFMAEERCRTLMQEAGIRTYPRPKGIPENFRVRIVDNCGGLKYVHPEHTHTDIRVMSGMPHSPNLHQQTPYVIHKKNGKFLDKFGNVIEGKDAASSPAAHIPIDEFIFKN